MDQVRCWGCAGYESWSAALRTEPDVDWDTCDVCEAEFERRIEVAERVFKRQGVPCPESLAWAGFESLASIAAASDEELLRVRNVGPVVLARIRAVVPRVTPSVPNWVGEAVYEC